MKEMRVLQHFTVIWEYTAIKVMPLKIMTSLPQTLLEKTESLEQLRALENGMKIKTSVVDFVPVGIDTKEDLEKFRQIVAKKEKNNFLTKF